MDDNIYDILYGLRDYFYEVMYQFRLFLFGLEIDDNNIRHTIIFIFLTIPIFFALFEAFFDWLLPTFLGLRPMGIKRFFVPHVASLRVPEVKAYKPISSTRFSSVFVTRFEKIRFYHFHKFRYNINYKPDELKQFRIMFQQKFNYTPSPIELRRFIITESRSFDNSPNNFGLKRSLNGAVDLGQGVSSNLKSFKNWKESKNKEERKEVTGFRGE